MSTGMQMISPELGRVIFEQQSPELDGLYQETVIGVSTNHIRLVRCHTDNYTHLYRIETDDSVFPYCLHTEYVREYANNWFYSAVKFPPNR